MEVDKDMKRLQELLEGSYIEKIEYVKSSELYLFLSSSDISE